MGERTAQRHETRKTEMMEQCFACMAEYGMSSVGIRTLSKACGCTSAVLYDYFENVDDLIVQATEHCMSRVEDEFMARAPTGPEDIERFMDEIPYWTAAEHGRKYRLMYQIYTHPKYIDHGKRFFEGVNRRYSAYAASLAERLDLPAEVITPLIFLFVRACVHYALFEDEYYLKTQVGLLKTGLRQCMTAHGAKQ